MRIENITDLIAFKHIVKEGSFRAAARKTGLSCAGVTKRLQRLEEQLNLRLMNRSTRQLSLTEEGRYFYEYCLQILGVIEEAESYLENVNGDIKGSLRIALPDYFGRKNILPILHKLTNVYPKLNLLMDLSDQIVNVIEGGYDVAVRISNLKDSNLIAKKIGVEQRVVVASPDYLAKHAPPTTPEDLLKHNCLLYCNPNPIDQWQLSGPNSEIHVTKVSGNFKSNNCESLRESVIAGMGIALRPLWDVLSDVQSGALKILLPDYLPPSVNIQIIYPSREHLSLKARAFIDLVTDEFKNNSSERFDKTCLNRLLNSTSPTIYTNHMDTERKVNIKSIHAPRRLKRAAGMA